MTDLSAREQVDLTTAELRSNVEEFIQAKNKLDAAIGTAATTVFRFNDGYWIDAGGDLEGARKTRMLADLLDQARALTSPTEPSSGQQG